MNLEPIDTSTTAGKAEVMRLAAEGRKVAARRYGEEWIVHHDPHWDRYRCEYAIIAEPVGPEELWVVLHKEGDHSLMSDRAHAEDWQSTHGEPAIRYTRADLAGEVKP